MYKTYLHNYYAISRAYCENRFVTVHTDLT